MGRNIIRSRRGGNVTERREGTKIERLNPDTFMFWSERVLKN